MLRRILTTTAALAAVGCCANVLAVEDCGTDCDTSNRQGRVFGSADSVVTLGSGSSKVVRTWVPLLIDDAGSILNNSVVQIVDGNIVGATTTFGTNINAVHCLDLVDDANGRSNDIMVFEGIAGRSDTVGEMLSDGRIVYRANFGSGQNNLETLRCVPGAVTPFPEPNFGDPILSGPGIDGTPGGSVFAGTPSALADGLGGMFVGNTNFDLFSGAIPNGVNVWRYSGTPVAAATPNVISYGQTVSEAYANSVGIPIDPGDGRQTQPAFANVGGRSYIIFGLNDTSFPPDTRGPGDNSWGGVSRPRLLVIDAFEESDPNDPYAAALPLIAPDGWWFVDHKQNGGGTNVIENKHFDMNDIGQLAVLAESIFDPNNPNEPISHRVLLYNPVLDKAGTIIGFDPPITIADGGPLGTIDEGIAGPIAPDPNAPNFFINTISGVGINNRGNIAFSATFDTGVPVDPNNPGGPTILDGAAYFWDSSTSSLHQVLREFDLVTRDPVNADLNNPSADPAVVRLGLIPQIGTDHFMATSLANDADVMAVNFRSSGASAGGSRGVALVAVGHIGDINFDGVVSLADLAIELSAFGSSQGDANYRPQADMDNNGVIELADLAILLAVFGQAV